VDKFLIEICQKGLAENNGYLTSRAGDLYRKLQSLISKLPVFGFNFAKFDYKILRSEILCALKEKSMGGPASELSIFSTQNILKKIDTSNLMFMDVLSYLGGPTSYDNWTRKILGSRKKLFYPYDYMDSLEKLKERELPPLHCWMSGLKNCNILEQDKQLYEKYLADGKSEEEALKLLDLEQPPPNGEEKLQELKNEWQDLGFSTMRDYTNHYLTADLEPMAKCLKPVVWFI